MRHINLVSLIQASESLGAKSFDAFMKFHGITLRKGELEDLYKLVAELDYSLGEMEIFDNFYLGYKIPQIGKEFDLLRFSDNTIINIELKSSCTEVKAKNQLIRNRYYLKFTEKTVRTFTYISDKNELYELDENSNFNAAKIGTLKSLLKRQDSSTVEAIDALFDPSNYLVSPFNSTEKFLDDEYFLTHQQEEYKRKIIKSVEASTKAHFVSITGSAGTGKTLLVYDAAKELQGAGYKIAIIHCGYFNGGHLKLKAKGWNIFEIRNYRSCKLATFDIIIIDEAQRIKKEQFELIVAKVKDADNICIFSYDKAQTLSKQEERSDIGAEINKITQDDYSLSEKIRTNKEIADFIKALFNNTRNHALSNKGNIEVCYFNNVDDAKSYLSSLEDQEWEVIRFTPSQYNKEHHEKYFNQTGNTSHQVIGQEFDKVAIPIDQFFSYDANGDLYYKGRAYYHAAKMLFQNITRARKRLKLVIINNNEILSRCASILQ
ncbi:Phoh-like protein [Pseudomonas syringae pv. aptata]|uniref:DNA/RNA helicase domain-containing protein n=1 Tax=Pseudomonas syringae TaxID=317 RepID=UPI000EFF6CB0|nr:DNA/RNA helicase domain-containing protein [Pseudomonas syringae]RMM44348.1 Phoh-like protein [Pseudomonas syringae pv. aptata]